MSKTTLQHSKVIRSLAAAVVIICMVVFIGSGLVVMGDENFTSGVSEYVLLDDGTAEPVEQQEEDIWAAPPTDSSAAAETPSAGSVSPELQEKVIAFLHRMTGDMGLDLCAPFVQKNPEYIGGYNPAKPIDQKWIDPYYHVYSVMAGSDDQVPGEILSFSLGNAGLHGIKLVFTEDGYLQVRTDDWGTCSLYRYRYDDAQGSMVDAGTGKGEIQGNPFAGEETYWEYTVNGEVVDEARFDQIFDAVSNITLMEIGMDAQPTPYSMEPYAAQAYLEQIAAENSIIPNATEEETIEDIW